MSEENANAAGKAAAAQKKPWSPPALPFSVTGAASALYALFYTFCLYRNASGITYPFFVAGTLCYFFFCMKRYRASCGDSQNEIPGAHFTQRDRQMIGFYTVSLLGALRYLDMPILDAWDYVQGKGKSEQSRKLKYVFLGLLITVPLFLVIAALLLSADAVFASMTEKLLGELKVGNIMGICLMIACGYLLSYGFVRGLTTRRMPAVVQKEKKGEPVVAITFTGLTAVLYLVFCTIQVVYLFAGRMQLPEGLTWSAYARQGCFQLLFVCLINLVLVLVCLALFRESRILKGLLTAISLMTYVLIASSAYRMLLYIQNYYLTFLRVFVLWALAVIAAIFAGVLVSIYRSSLPLFGYCTVVVTVFYIGLAFAKPDYWIARYDLAHAASWQEDTRNVDFYRSGQCDYDVTGVGVCIKQ